MMIQRVLQLLNDFLVHDGYTVSTASDGEEGVRVFTTGSFDVVITDVKMPKMDGVEMMKAIKAIDPTVEIIILTGYGTMEMTIDVLRSGGYDLLRKPDEVPQRIRPTVQRAIERRRLGLRNQELLHALEEANATLEARVRGPTSTHSRNRLGIANAVKIQATCFRRSLEWASSIWTPSTATCWTT